MMTLLDVQHITKRFGGLTAVNNVSFHVDKGEVVSIIGPNGAGKTTVFNILTGVYEIEEGKIFFEGKEIQNQAPQAIVKAGISRTFQNIRLFMNMRVLENVLVGTHINTEYGFIDALFRTPKWRRIEAEKTKRAIQILKSIVDMAYRLGLVIIAEGVETKEQSEILKSMNCNYGQGFYFHRPMSVEAAEELIQTIPIENFRAAHEQVSRIRNVCEALPDSPEMWKLGDNIFRILLDHMLLLSRFNLITGGMETIKRDSSLAGFGIEYETDYQTYMSRLLNEQLVHPDDADEFRSIMTLDQLRLRMFHEKGSVIYRFRRKFKAGYFWTSLELFPDTECSKENPWVVMVIHESPSVNPDL